MVHAVVERLCGSDNQRWVAVVGPRGSGKSTVAAHAAHYVAQRGYKGYRHAVVVDVRGIRWCSEVAEVLLRCLSKLSPSTEDALTGGRSDDVPRLLRVTAGLQPCLLVLTHCDQCMVLRPGVNELESSLFEALWRKGADVVTTHEEQGVSEKCCEVPVVPRFDPVLGARVASCAVMRPPLPVQLVAAEPWYAPSAADDAVHAAFWPGSPGMSAPGVREFVHRVAALSGVRGVGKTACAVRYAFDAVKRGLYPGGVFWVGEDLRKPDWGRLTSACWLLVIDKVDTRRALDRLHEVLPGTLTWGHILVASRQPRDVLAVNKSLARCVFAELKPLGEAAAMTLVLRRACTGVALSDSVDFCAITAALLAGSGVPSDAVALFSALRGANVTPDDCVSEARALRALVGSGHLGGLPLHLELAGRYVANHVKGCYSFATLLSVGIAALAEFAPEFCGRPFPGAVALSDVYEGAGTVAGELMNRFWGAAAADGAARAGAGGGTETASRVRTEVITQAVSGLGGVGKTEAASRYARRCWEEGRYPGGVLYVANADDSTLLNASLRDIAVTSLGLKHLKEEPNDKVLVELLRWFADPDGMFLLLIDNADRPSLRELVSLLPPTCAIKGHVLLTSRARRDFPLALSGEPIDVPLLSPADSRRALLKYSGRLGSAPTGGAEADALDYLSGAEGFAGLPLALLQAGTYLRQRPVVTFDEYRRDYDARHIETLDMTPDPTAELRAWVSELCGDDDDMARTFISALKGYGVETLNGVSRGTFTSEKLILGAAVSRAYRDLFDDAATRLRDVAPGQSVRSAARTIAATWGISFKELRTLSPAAAELMHALAFCGADGIPDEIWLDGADGIGDVVRRSELAKALGCDREKRKGVLRELFSALEVYSLVTRRGDTTSVHRLVQEVLRFPPRALAKMFPPRAVSRAAALACASACTMLPDPALAFMTGAYPAERSIVHASIAVYQALFRDVAPLRVAVLSTSTSVAGGGSDVCETEGSEHVVSCRPAAASFDDDVSYGNLAVRAIRGACILSLAGAKFGSVDLSAVDGASLVSSRSRQWCDAAGSICGRISGREQRWIADIQHAITYIRACVRKGDVRGARESLDFPERGLRGLLRTHAATGSAVRTTSAAGHAACGEALYAMSELPGAHDEFVVSLNLLRQLYGECVDHAAVSAGLNNLASVVEARGNLVEAERLYRESLEMMKRVYGEGVDHAEVATGLNNLAGVVVRARGNLAEAERLYRESLEMSKRVYGEGVDHAAVASCLFSLGIFVESRNRYWEAHVALQQAANMMVRVSAVGDGLTKCCMEALRRCREEMVDKDKWRHADGRRVAPIGPCPCGSGKKFKVCDHRTAPR